MILFSYYSRNMIVDVILCAGYYTRYLENKNSLCPLEMYSLVGNTGLIKYWELIYNYKLRYMLWRNRSWLWKSNLPEKNLSKTVGWRWISLQSDRSTTIIIAHLLTYLAQVMVKSDIRIVPQMGLRNWEFHMSSQLKKNRANFMTTLQISFLGFLFKVSRCMQKFSTWTSTFIRC